jgi:hypothetical protein
MKKIEAFVLAPSLAIPTQQPSWWTDKGVGMTILLKDHKDFTLSVSSRGHSASLEIVYDGNDEISEEYYKVSSTVIHNYGSSEGMVYLEQADIQKAFGLSDGMSRDGVIFAERCGYHASAAEPGRYFRFGRYLNLPHPGMGIPGDPNLSMFISDEVARAVYDLLVSPK